MDDYQTAYSLINPAVLDKSERKKKAMKIQRVLEDYGKNHSSEDIILDIGCSGGVILDCLSISCGYKIGIDIDINALKIAKKNKTNSTLHLICGDGMYLPFRDDTIGFTLCNHVYEHLPDSEKLFSEIFRILKPCGVCYCAAGNVLKIMEAHYQLPFLSWLPKKFAHHYLRITHRGDYYYEKHLNWWQFQRKIRKFIIHDYTLRIIRDPKNFCSEDIIQSGSLISRFPPWILRISYPFIPTWILMLEKPGPNK